MTTEIKPKDPAEAVALYRAQIVGPLVRRELERGELASALAELSKTRFRPPRAHGARSYSVATLERWYYAFREGGLEALRPKERSDRGRGRELTDEQKKLLLDIRRENPEVSAATILRTLEVDGRIEQGTLVASTLRRFYAAQGFDRVGRAATSDGKVRLRWQAAHPGALWQGDVCHAAPIVIDGKPMPVRIHALLDDASRYVVAIEARHQEREVDMLAVLVRALRKHGAPDALYLDNGATYRGETLSLACARLGTSLVHAKPYDAPARGKMERFWRTLREQCLVFCKDLSSLHEVNVRILAWLDVHYHRAPHGGLMGKSPETVFAAAAGGATDDLDEDKLRRALTVRERRRVRRDNTLAMDGTDWETSLHFLAGRLVTVARSLVDADAPPWIEYEDKVYPLVAVDPVRNARRARSPQSLDRPHPARVAFDPAVTLVDRAVGRAPRSEEVPS